MQGEGRDQRAWTDTELPERTRVPLSSPGSRATLGASAGLGAEGIRQTCCLLLGLLALGAGGRHVPSRLCSAGAGGRGAHGPPAHSGAAASHACPRPDEVRAQPLAWQTPLHSPWPWAWPWASPIQAESSGALRGPALCHARGLWRDAGESRGILQLPAKSRLLPKVGGGSLCLPRLSFGLGHGKEGGGASWQGSLHTRAPSLLGTSAPEVCVQLPKARRQRSQRPCLTRPSLSLFSKVEMVLEGKKQSLSEACFRKVLLLPPDTATQSQGSFLYFKVSAVVLPGAPRAAPWLARDEPQPGIHGTLGSRLYFPTPFPSSPSRGPRHVQCLWTGSSAHCSLSAPRPPLATRWWQECPPLVWGVRSIPGERGTAERLT